MDVLALAPEVLKMTIALFIVVNPLGNVPIFVGLTKNMDPTQRKKTYQLATITGLILLTFFSLVGQNILVLFGIEWDSFLIAGGILLLIVAIRLLVTGGLERTRKLIRIGRCSSYRLPSSCRSRSNNNVNSEHSILRNIGYITFCVVDVCYCMADSAVHRPNIPRLR